MAIPYGGFQYNIPNESKMLSLKKRHQYFRVYRMAADPDDQHVKVAVRCRPLNEEEAAMNAEEKVSVHADQG